MDYIPFKEEVNQREDILVGEQRAYIRYLNQHKKKHSMSRMENKRDTEAGKVYKAERALYKTDAFKSKQKTYKTLEEIQKRANQICKSAAFKKVDAKGGHKVKIRDKANYQGRGCHGWSYIYEITLDKVNGYNLYVLLHELSHAAGQMHHGREFRNVLLKLVSAFMGRDCHDILKKEFKKLGLKVGKHPTPYTFERWHAAREKMAAMRSKL